MTNRFCGSVSAIFSGEGPELVNPFREAEPKFLLASDLALRRALAEGGVRGTCRISVWLFSEGGP